MQWYSQWGQDEFVVKYFKEKKNGIFFEAGALDGLEASNTLALERSYGWTGVLVEPLPEMYNQLIVNRPSCHNFHLALYNRQGTIIFQKNDGEGRNLSGVPEAYHPKHSKWANSVSPNIQNINLPCDTLANVLHSLNIHRVDYLSLDTEGSELQILENFNTKEFDIELLTIEVNDYTDFEEKITKMMDSKGYEVIARLVGDLVFKKKGLIPWVG